MNTKNTISIITLGTALALSGCSNRSNYFPEYQCNKEICNKIYNIEINTSEKKIDNNIIFTLRVNEGDIRKNTYYTDTIPIPKDGTKPVLNGLDEVEIYTNRREITHYNKSTILGQKVIAIKQAEFDKYLKTIFENNVNEAIVPYYSERVLREAYQKNTPEFEKQITTILKEGKTIQ
jgi:hypothetical protein